MRQSLPRKNKRTEGCVAQPLVAAERQVLKRHARFCGIDEVDPPCISALPDLPLVVVVAGPAPVILADDGLSAPEASNIRYLN